LEMERKEERKAKHQRCPTTSGCSPARFPTPTLASYLQSTFFRQSFLLLLLRFFIIFFFPLASSQHHERLELYEITLNDERKVLSCPSLSYHD
jgi:hypothetical protein